MRTPAGFRDAYAALVAGGWRGLGVAPERGGAGLPAVVQAAFEEMACSANLAFATYPLLSAGAAAALAAHGSAEQVERYVPRLASGEWSGTMCLTEAQAGTDLGLLRTRAEPAADGTYRITGTKVFITGGEHDLTDQIVHLVLARLPDAPPGTAGISLFLVPKLWPPDGGGRAKRRRVRLDRAQDGHPRLGHLRAALRGRGRRARRPGRTPAWRRCSR